jgi:hypothetical protein
MQDGHKVVVAFEDQTFLTTATEYIQYLIKTKPTGGIQNFNLYTSMVLLWIVVFAIVYSVVYVFLDSVLYREKTSVFQGLSFQKKHDYTARVVSIIHAILVTVTSTIACFLIWYDTKSNPDLVRTERISYSLVTSALRTPATSQHIPR